MTAKEQVQEMLSELPDDCTLEEIEYRLYVLKKVQKGLEDAEAGRVVPLEEARKRFSPWRSDA